jgi:hypothetical protein
MKNLGQGLREQSSGKKKVANYIYEKKTCLHGFYGENYFHFFFEIYNLEKKLYCKS